MGGRIPNQFIDDLLGRLDIVEVINGRITLKKTGRDFQACCPFHSEKTPSFTVSQTKQFYHCFGCGAHGNAIGFLMEHDGYSFPEAVEELAHQAGLEVPHESNDPVQTVSTSVYEVLENASRFYKKQLRVHPQAIEYLKQRGLSGEIAARYQIGYAPPGWTNLMDHAGPGKIPLLRDAGLISEPEENKRYDRFRDRIMFPIRDRRGRTIGFGGRIIGDGKPKYLNSPETEVFHKGMELYGLYEARNATRKLHQLLVVEGYLDVVALAQYSIEYAVATLGTATTEKQLELMFRSTAEVVFCFDGDRAGRDAAWKALQIALPSMRSERRIKFLLLPEGDDPDTLVRRIGQTEFQRLVDESTDLPTFLFESLMQRINDESPQGRAMLADQARPLVSQVPSEMLRETMWVKLHELTGISIEKLSKGEKTATRTSPRTNTESGRNVRRSAVRHAVTLLLQYPDIARQLPENDEWKTLDAPGVPLLRELLELIQTKPNLSTGALIEHWRGKPEASYLGTLAVAELGITSAEIAIRELSDCMAKLTLQNRQQETQTLIEKARFEALSEAEKARLQQLLSQASSQRSDLAD